MSSSIAKRNSGVVDTYKGSVGQGVAKAAGYTAGLWLLSLAPFISLPFLMFIAFVVMMVR